METVASTPPKAVQKLAVDLLVPRQPASREIEPSAVR